MTYKVIGIGELLWDELPTGRQMGGAPANFAYHARALGADARVVSRVGNDELGLELIRRLQALDVPTSSIAVDETHPTGTVTVDLAPGGQPCFTIHEDVAWDYLRPDPELVAMVSSADAICFGTLGQRCEPSRSAIRTLLQAAPERAVRVFDVNLRQNFYSQELIESSLQFSEAVKLNDAELPTVARMLGLAGTAEAQLAALLDRYSLQLVACTRGSEGSLLYNGKDWAEQAGLSVDVKDTIGAGDSFTAAVTLGLLAGWEIEKIGTFANAVAAYVCSCEGATPSLPEQFRNRFLTSPVAHFGL